MPEPLPIDGILPAAAAALSADNCLVIVAEPGAGKTTRVPPLITKQPWCRQQTILLQPRRVAARLSAARIAEEQQWSLGKEVGYRIRYEYIGNRQSRLMVVTEGILTARLQDDPALEDVSTVILDEFHERSIHSDLALAMLREVQTALRPDLRIVVMSATLDAEAVSKYLGHCPILKSEGRAYPVEHIYAARYDSSPLEVRCADAIENAAKQTPTREHILVFLPGLGSIRRVENLLRNRVARPVHILHSSVPAAHQEAAMRPDGEGRIVLSTNIAETSVTVPGVTTVIDSGWARSSRVDPASGFEQLIEVRISHASATQRAGRAGRTAPGRCIRLYTVEEFQSFPQFDAPDIHRIDLLATVLSLKLFGQPDATAFPWFEAPQAKRLQDAENTARLINLADNTGRITGKGRAAARLPVDPKTALIALSLSENGHHKRACRLAAALADPSGFKSMPRLATTRDLLQGFDELERAATPHAPWIKLANHIERQLATRPEWTLKKVSWETAVCLALLGTHPDRVAARRPDNPQQAVRADGRGVLLPGHFPQAGNRLALAVDIDLKPEETNDTALFALDVPMRVLEENHPDWLDISDTPRMDPASGKVLMIRRTTFLGLLIDERITGVARDDSAASVRLQVQIARRGSALIFLQSSALLDSWIKRYNFAARHGGKLPLLDFDELAATFIDFHPQPLAEHRAFLQQWEGLNYAAAREVDQVAPEFWTAPSSSRIAIVYPQISSNESPVVAIRLQELFGLNQIPMIGSCKVPLCLHLLGPNFRPVQITSDLPGFWQRTYPTVKKELMRRYPRHPWPEDPLSAPPKAMGGRRKP